MSTIFDRKGQIMTTKTNVLLLYPELAAEIGVNEAIILAQLHYWIEKNKQQGVNYRDGRTWVFQTYKEWNEQFIFWCERAIINIIYRLEKRGYVIAGNYNKKKYDNTKWYTIAYEKLPENLLKIFQGGVNEVHIGSCTEFNADFEGDARPIQENNKDNNKREYTPSCEQEVFKASERVPYGEYGWVRLTDDEVISLLVKHGEEAVNRGITYIDISAQKTNNRNGWADWCLTVDRAISENWGGILNGIC